MLLKENKYFDCANAELGNAADVENEYVSMPGMSNPPTVAAYIESQYGLRHDFIGWVILILFAYIFVFLGVAAVSLKKLNFQQK